MVQADVIENDRGRVDTEVPGEAALEADRHVAQADGLVPGVEQGPGDDADRVGEVDDPGARLGPPADPVGDVEHHRHRAQRLAQPSRAGRLLPYAAALERERLVADPRLLPADP